MLNVYEAFIKVGTATVGATAGNEAFRLAVNNLNLFM